MPTTNNEKTGSMEENKQSATDFELDRRLVEEINILKLEGSLFCFDPKEAKRRGGKFTLADARKEPVTILIHPAFGQPSVLSYKVLQAGFLKLMETGCTLSEDGHCNYGGKISFGARELALLTGRAWGGRTSKQLFEAVMQLRSTQIFAHIYDKKTTKWQVRPFEVFADAIFSGEGETISQCVLEFHSVIVDSINLRHVATFNFNRLNTLDTIGLVLYKRIFFHFSNLMHERKREGSLKFTKDYDAICAEWLGGLKREKYKSKIIQNQFGRHFNALKATGLISRATVGENKADTGFNLTFYPGPGFFEDYQAYYLDKKPARQTMRTVVELQEVKALELVAYFHRQLGRKERTRFEDHETAYADELLATHTEAEVRDLIDHTIAEAKRTNWPDMLYLGACKRFVDDWSASANRRKERERREEAVAACPHCTKDGIIELREEGSGRMFVHLCPHKLELITRIEDGLKAYRV